MKISVNYSGPLKDVTGKGEEQIELDDHATIYHLIQKLEQKHGASILNLLDINGDVKDDVQLFINGRLIKSHKELYGNLLTEGAVAAILSLRGGG